MDQGLVKIVSPIDETPAFRAGLKPGDYITNIDGETVIGMTLNEAVDKMRGKPGTKIKLTIRRVNEKPFDVTLKREEIKKVLGIGDEYELLYMIALGESERGNMAYDSSEEIKYSMDEAGNFQVPKRPVEDVIVKIK